MLDRLVADVRAGQSRALVVRGEAGIGKTALLEHLVAQARGCRIARVAGVECEMELAFAGLHQLCSPLLDHLDRLPPPQGEALAVAFGVRGGAPPDRFLVSLAVLSLLAEVAEEQPLVCVIDDAQWLDRASSQALAFVGRRLVAESVAVVFAVRTGTDAPDLTGLAALEVEGLADGDAAVLLDSVVTGPLDRRVRDRIIAETRGNPLALLEWSSGRTPAELAGGFGVPDTVPVGGRLEHRFVQRLLPLPVETRRLLLTAAAEPVGDVSLLWRALERLGIDADAVAPAEAAELLEVGGGVRFRHPLVRAASYRSASPEERREVHRALADATDSELDPDRRAWHRAHATHGRDEDVAAELERSAGRAKARGGAAAAAAFLERAATLTPERARRAERELAAARAKRDVGALDAALGLLAAVEAGPPDAVRTAEVEHLRGQIAFDQRRGADAARLLLGAARHLEPIDADLARATHLEALGAAIWASGLESGSGLVEAAEAARAAPPAPAPPRPVDLVLDALATRFTEGYVAAAPALTDALDVVRSMTVSRDDVGRWLWLAGNRASGIIALEVWDFEARYELATRQVDLARNAGALVQLQFALNFLANTHLLAGDLTKAASLIDEDHLLAEATGNAPVAYSPLALAAARGRDAEASQLISATLRDAAARGQGRMVTFATYTSAVLHNGLGRYALARDAAWRVFERDLPGYGPMAVPELAEAASRTGDMDLVAVALEWLSERARVTPTDWVLGIEARVGALLAQGDAADGLHRSSIDHLDRTPVRAEVARSRLLYGEWLRREGRRRDAREQLRLAHEMFATMGMEGFAERARRELLATGETVRRRTVEARDELTAQEARIAHLAAEGNTNPEIGTRLFISSRTVEWHLRKVFTKLGVSSRRELRAAVSRTG